MIKCENGTTEINGSVTELMVDYTLITRMLIESFTKKYGEDEAKKRIERAYGLGFMSEAELDAERNAAVESFANFMSHIWGGKNNE